ncbi:MAG: hypothetical protein EP329_00320, partial [Deltaproteobacteria bacterium]
MRRLALTASLGVLCALLTTAAQAAPPRDSELAALSDAAYLKDNVTLDAARFHELDRVNDAASGVQALIVELLPDHAVVVAFAGTDKSDPKDLLSGAGLVGKEITYALGRAVFALADQAVARGWAPKGAAPLVREALARDFGGLDLGKAAALPKGALKLSCPAGSFFDLREGGECWACPDGAARTGRPVDHPEACRSPEREDLKPATRTRKNTGIGQGCPRGQIWDLKGGNGVLGACYACPAGYGRTAYAIDDSRACVARFAASLAPAALKAKALCPRGAFFDAVDGGTCWACPAGHVRTASGVKA